MLFEKRAAEEVLYVLFLIWFACYVMCDLLSDKVTLLSEYKLGKNHSCWEISCFVTATEEVTF